jgi:hypothetical protein
MRYYFRLATKPTVKQKSKKNDSKAETTSIGSIRDELFLISFIVLCAGLVYTDAYYQRFGFRYNSLNITTVHIVYKGLAMVLMSPLMLIPYGLTLALRLFEIYAIKTKLHFFLELRTPIIYGFLVVTLSMIYYLAQEAGMKQARRDMFASSSDLPKIICFKSDDIYIDPTAKKTYLLFLNDGDFVTIFSPLLDTEKNAFPILKRVSQSQVTYIETKL